MSDLPSLSGVLSAMPVTEWFEWLMVRIDRHLLSTKSLQEYGKLTSFLAVALLFEIASRKDWHIRYRSRNFRVDSIYYVFYYSGLYHFLIMLWIYRGLDHLVTSYAPWLHMNLLASMSLPMQILTLVVVSDFFGYWEHRVKHANRYLWAFHTIHHSQTTLTAMANYRVHFVDATFFRIWMFIPLQILGANVTIWLFLDFLMAWVLLAQHSEWDWSYGWAGRVVVSPRFHRQHHSVDEQLQNRNFSMLFSFWDDLFGTAERRAACPARHGLAGNPVPEGWLGQLAYPFIRIAREIRQPRSASVDGIAPPPPVSRWR